MDSWLQPAIILWAGLCERKAPRAENVDSFCAHNGLWCTTGMLLLLVRSLSKVLTERQFCLLDTSCNGQSGFILGWQQEGPCSRPWAWALHVLCSLCPFLLLRGLWNLVYNYTDLSVLLPELASPQSSTSESFRTCSTHTLPACTKLCWSRTPLMLAWAVFQHWKYNFNVLSKPEHPLYLTDTNEIRPMVWCEQCKMKWICLLIGTDKRGRKNPQLRGGSINQHFRSSA